MTTDHLPTISILVVNKDSTETLGRCLDSLFALDYPNLHIVVQDGVSTDGSLELLRSYGDRIDLVSEKDRDQNDAFVRGLRRCTGDIVGFCWADEELLPHAAQWAVTHLWNDSAVGAVYGDFIETDATGVGENPCKYPEWDLERVYAYEFIPPVCSSFFRREAIEEYLRVWEFSPDCTEYVLWASVGARFQVKQIPEVVSRYARHENQLSMQPRRIDAYPDHVVRAIDAFANAPDAPAVMREQAGRARCNVHLWAAQWLATECEHASESCAHLERALGHDIDATRLTMMLLECLKHYLARRSSRPMFDLLDAVGRSGISLAAEPFCRAMVEAQCGRRPLAHEIARQIPRADHIADLTEMMTQLVEELFGRECVHESEYALQLFWHLGKEDPEFYQHLTILLSNLRRHSEALVVNQKLLEADPDDENAMGVRDQLQIIDTIRLESLRRGIADVAGQSGVMPIQDALPIAQSIWQCTMHPESVSQASARNRASLTSLVKIFRDGAVQAQHAELQGKLDTVLAHLEATPVGASAQ